MTPLFDIMARHMNVRRVFAFGLGVLSLDFVLFVCFSFLDFSDVEPTFGVRFLGLAVLVISWPAILLDFILPKSLDMLGLVFGLVPTVLFWGVLFEMTFQRFTRKRPNQSPEPTAVTPSVPLSRTAVSGRRWLSFFR
jgi:hypothetical protein